MQTQAGPPSPWIAQARGIDEWMKGKLSRHPAESYPGYKAYLVILAPLAHNTVCFMVPS
jgi:hypothetical protein